MTYQQVYKSQHARIVRENVLKAAIYSIVAGLGVAAVIAFVTIFVEFNGLWTAIGAGVGVAAVMTPILYFTLFRPSEKSVAESLDRLGFDERAITMLELQGESSVMADLQRNDAVNTFTAAAENNGGKIPAKAVPVSQRMRALGLNTAMLIIAGVVVVFAVISLVLTALPTQQVKEMFLGTNSYNVTYNAGGHGYIVTESGDYKYDAELARVGKYSMKIDEGKMGERIVISAYTDPENPYMFVGWSDDYYDMYNAAARIDKGVMGITATANYEQIKAVVEDGENDEPSGANPPPCEHIGGNEQGFPSGNTSDLPGNDGASSSETPLNGEIIDGQTDYQESFQDNYDSAMDRLSSSKDVPDSLSNMVTSYFEALK